MGARSGVARDASGGRRAAGERMHADEGAAKRVDRVPRIAAACDPARLELSPAEGYLLSRIDGSTSWRLLREIGGLPPEEVDRRLDAWAREGIVVFEGEPPQGDAKAGPAEGAAARAESGEAKADAAGAAASGATGARNGESGGEEAGREPSSGSARAGASDAAQEVAAEAIDPSLDIPVELQRRILAFEAGLDRPYHEILGVPRDADRRALKKAYFRLSREVHPDRYFRRNVGPFGPRLERCFKRLLEAYELLSDPATRAEVQRNEAEAPPPPRPEESAAASRPAAAARPAEGPPRPALDEARKKRLAARLRALRGPRRAPDPRREKARAFFESGLEAFEAGRWLEAAGSVRLAIAFDPRNEAFRERFADVQRRAHEEQAKQLVRRAESALDVRDVAEAFRHLEEAAHYRPYDAELAARAARLGWQSGADLRRAKSLAQSACETEPERAELRRLLGQIYKAAGLAANARRELRAALERDPKDAEAKAELKSL